MKNIMKFVFGALFSLGFLISANAQTDTSEMYVPSPDDIVCVQVAENVFECAVTDPRYGQEQENEMNQGTEEDELLGPDSESDSYEDIEGQDPLDQSDEQLYMEEDAAEQEIFKEGTTEEEKRGACERIMDEDQSRNEEHMDQQLYEEGGTESDEGIYMDGSSEQDYELQDEGTGTDRESEM